MRRIGTILLLCVLLGFGWSVNGVWAFNKKPTLPSSKVSSDAIEHSQVLNVTEDVSARTLHTKRWIVDNPQSQKTSYTEVHPGLHVLNSDATYQEADPTLTLTRNGAQSKRLTHPVRFQNELSYGRPTVEQGDVKNPVLEASPSLIVYRDLKTDRSVVLARSKPASLTFKKNIATYQDAFDHLRADVRYTVRTGNLEQDVLLYEKPLKPSAYGLNDDSTVLAVMTRVFSLDDQLSAGSSLQSPSTRQTLAQTPSDLKLLMTPRIAGPIVLEQNGTPIQQFARSYVLSENSKQAVHKQLVTVQGIHFLAEEIPARYFQEQDLPIVKGPAIAKHIPFTQLEVLANANFTPQSQDRLAEVRPTLISAPIVIDFISVTGTVADFTFAEGETYLVSGPVIMTGITTFESGAVIKFNATGSLDVSDPVFNTTSSDWVVFTSKNDDSVGEVVSGSTGSPSSYPNALTLAKGSVRYAQIRHANEGIVFPGDATLNVRDSEFFAVGTSINASSVTKKTRVFLNNLLIAQGTTGMVLTDGNRFLDVTINNMTMAHMTGVGFDNATTKNKSDLNVTDSLFVDVQGTAVFSGTAPNIEDYNAFFQTPDTGTGANNITLTTDPILTDWFLDQTSPVINAGSNTGFNTGLYHYTTDTNGAIEANSQVDIGYHFAPKITDFAAFSIGRHVALNGPVHSGKIGSNAVATYGSETKGVIIDSTGETDAGVDTFGDQVDVQGTANGDIYTNDLDTTGTVNGSVTNPLYLPIIDPLPPFKTTNLGTVSDITVPPFEELILPPGDYGDVFVDSQSSLVFTGGVYNMRSFKSFPNNARSVTFQAPTEVRIEQEMDIHTLIFAPAEGTSLSADQIRFYVAGVNSTSEAAHISSTSQVVGYYYVPNGTLRVRANLGIRGILIADRVITDTPLTDLDLDAGGQENIVASPIIIPQNSVFDETRFEGSVEVTMSTPTPGAEIHYVLGTLFEPTSTKPTAASPLYTGPLTFTDHTFISAIAILPGYEDSSITFTYYIKRVDRVVFDPAPGLFAGSTNVSLSTPTAGATIYYTTDGTDPTTASTVFTTPIPLTATTTIKAFATKTNTIDSVITSGTYTLAAGTVDSVAFSPPGGTFQDSVGVTLSTPTTGATIHYTTDGTDPTTASPVFTTPINLTATTTVKAFAVQAGWINSVITSEIYTIESAPTIPGGIANSPSLEETVIFNVATSSEFLYTGIDGASPLQFGATQNDLLDPSVFEPVRAAVVRGQVLDRAGNPLPGVTVTIMGHDDPLDPEYYGQTLSRNDGFYDMAVNGGGQLVVQYEKTDDPLNQYLPAQRKVQVPWQDFAIVDNVVLVPLDSQMTTVDLAAIPAGQVFEARGSLVTDGDGERTATLLFSSDTTATMKFADGSPDQQITSLSVRATEYTVGPNGPMAMPAKLPPMSGYTYAAEFSVDEALNTGATSVEFNQPVYGYVENFLNFPTGENVPSGFYDKAKGQWVPSDSGLVINILSITNGEADLDTDGDGLEDNNLGLTLGELQKLAQLYPLPPQSLWRVPVDHFSTYDWNWSKTQGPADAENPKNKETEAQKNKDECDTCQGGSTIQVDGQIFGESLHITGTPFVLFYNSDRVPGYKSPKLSIPVSGASLPASLLNIELEIEIAGRKIFFDLPPDPNQTIDFEWDGLDAYGRPVSGSTVATIQINYIYPAMYRSTSSFGGSGTLANIGTARTVATRPQKYSVVLERNDVRSLGLGGWALNVNHLLNTFNNSLLLGNGNRQTADSINATIVTVAGDGSNGGGIIEEGGSPLVFGLRDPRYVEVDEKGNIFFSDRLACVIRKVTAEGLHFTVAGITDTCGFNGDDISATSAQLSNPSGLALDTQGNLYIADAGNRRIRKVDTNGTITTVAGTGTSGFNGDGQLAVDANLNSPFGVAIDGQDNLLIADNSGCRIRKVDTNGIISTVAGTNTCGIPVDGMPAVETRILVPADVVVDSEGNFYFGNTLTLNPPIWKVGTDGIINGIPVVEFNDQVVWQMAVDQQDNLYLGAGWFRKINSDGVITTVAGTGSNSGTFEENAPVSGASAFGLGIAVHPDGSVLIADTLHRRIRRIRPAFPGFSNQDRVIPSKDGSQVYVFDSTGRHQQSLNAMTGAVIFDFEYDSAGRIISITDGDGDQTTIQRDVDGKPLSITSADGQVTTLTLDANGFLASATNPNTEAFQMVYTPDGLMTRFTRPRGNFSTMTYDSLGRLIRDENSGGGFMILARTDTENSHETSVTTAEGRKRLTPVEKLTGGNKDQVLSTDSNGLVTKTINGHDDSQTFIAPSGAFKRITKSPDPRFGMLAPLLSVTVGTPGGLSSTVTHSRSVSLNAAGVLTSQTDTVNINGRITTSVFDKVDPLANPGEFRFVGTSSLGRTSTSFSDEHGRVIQQQVPGIFNRDFSYDETRGRLTGSTQGDRTMSVIYNAAGFIDHVTDTLDRTLSFEYDNIGLLTKQILPDLREINYLYDANGNLTSITPPGRPNHQFGYNAVDLKDLYTPPNVTPPLIDPKTYFTYNLDKQVTSVTRPDGKTILMGYDPGGRLSTLTLPDSPPGTPQVYTYTYNGTTGNLTMVTAPDGGNLTFTHDGGLLLSTTWNGLFAAPTTVSRTYGADLRTTSRSVNGAHTISFGYDDDSLLTSAGAETLDYDPIDPATGLPIKNGKLTGTTLGAVTDSYTYSGYGEVSNYSAQVNAVDQFVTAFNRDKMGRITQKTETVLNGPVKVTQYDYDIAGRLETVTDVTDPVNPVQLSSYSYDLNGNRLNNGATYDDQDRLISTSTATYTYTDNGELLTKTEGADITQYKYDVLGNLRSVILPSGTLIEYVIDANSRRIGRKVDGVLQKAWLYTDGLNPIAELDGVGNVIARFVYASRANVPDYVIVPAGTHEGTYRIISDHLGSPRLIVNIVDGTIKQEIEYDEWGNEAGPRINNFPNPFTFVGGLYDADTKLIRFGARDYDPEVGRWTAKDPIRFDGDGPNLYGYSLNDPVNIFDPMGFWSKEVHDYFIRRYGLRHNLTENQIRDMQRGSEKADSLIAPGPGGEILGNQSSDRSYIHAMTSSTYPDKAEACALSNQFISQNLGLYNGLLSGEISPIPGSGRANGLRTAYNNPYFRLGMALHTVMDSTSPAHVGFQYWEWLPPWETPLRHGSFEHSEENVAALIANQHLIDETLDLMDSVMNGGSLDCSCYQ